MTALTKPRVTLVQTLGNELHLRPGLFDRYQAAIVAEHAAAVGEAIEAILAEALALTPPSLRGLVRWAHGRRTADLAIERPTLDSFYTNSTTISVTTDIDVRMWCDLPQPILPHLGG